MNISSTHGFFLSLCRALDFLLSEANKYGIRVILSFVDNWKYHGGVDQIVDWSSTAPKRLYPRPTDKLGDFTQKDMNETLKEYEVRRHAYFADNLDVFTIKLPLFKISLMQLCG